MVIKMEKELTLFETMDVDRKVKNLDVRSYCKKLGISVRTYYKLKNSNPQGKTLNKIADETGISVRELLSLPKNQN